MSADKANEDNVTREEEEEEADELDTTTAANNPEDESSQDDSSNHDDDEDVDGTIRRRVSDDEDEEEVVDKQPLGNILGNNTQGVDAVPDLVNVPIVAGNQPPPQPPAAVAAPQAQQQAAGGGRGGGGIMQNNGENISIRIPIFRGDSQDSITVQQWVDTLTRAKWKENLQWGSAAEKDALESWADLFPLLTARYLRTEARADKVKSIGSLVQARREELVTYWDRVDNVMKRCTKDKLAALPVALTPAQAYILARDNIAELLFMHGMLPDVRKTVESMAVEATT
jgi:hypothetical protein